MQLGRIRRAEHPGLNGVVETSTDSEVELWRRRTKSSKTPSAKSLVKDAQSQGLARPVAQEVVDDAISEGVAPEKLKEVVEEAAKVEQEDRKAGQHD